jgi:hypothetical protein
MKRIVVLLTAMGVAILLATGMGLLWDLGPSGSSVARAQAPPPDDHRTEENAASQQANTETLSGTFHVVWGDPRPNSDLKPKAGYVLSDGRGPWEELLLDNQVAKPLGGPLALNGERVVVEGTKVEEDHVKVQSIQLANAEKFGVSAEGPEPVLGAHVVGSQPWVTIGCRFSDSIGVTPRPVNYFDDLMGTTEPGFDHFWRQLSYNSLNLTGSQVVAWYNLPQPRSFYIPPGGNADLDLLAQHCTAAADADMFFPDFDGINLMFNQNLDCCAYGGSETLIRDGEQRSYGMTWMPPWGYNNHYVLAQEMGHGFGLPHSSGPYSATYDSDWDPMSSGGTCSPPHAVFGCLGDHTIAFHKDMLHWIPAARKYMANLGTDRSITLERLALPTTTSNYLMAQIPIGRSTTRFYTVEARRFADYDNTGPIPGEAVVIHRVNTALDDRLAQVVDPDNNGNPNDAGAMWLPGETFTDSANAISVQVTGSTASGYTVRIKNDKPDASPPVHSLASNGLVKISWSATDSDGIARYELQRRSTIDEPYTNVSLPSATATSITSYLAPDTPYRFRVRAQDNLGYWSDWAYGNSLRFSDYQEDNPAVSYTYGLWSTQDYTKISGGYIKRSYSCPASAKFTFTGSSVAFFAVKDSSGDKITVTADGTTSTVDLSLGSGGSQAVFVKSWGSSASRSITMGRVFTGANPKTGMPTCAPYKSINVDAFRVLQ